IWAGLTGTAMFLPLISQSLIKQTETLSFYGWISVLYLALLSTVLGYSIFYTLVSRGAVSRLSIQLYLIPIVSVVGGIVLLQESVSIFMLFGGGLMLLAISLATRKRN
ncbi:MAG TPA: DMT family transporter, partial [Nitrososphaerales archaeon]|nr:DMT family transporter [Nitrososphaerales archaeon]